MDIIDGFFEQLSEFAKSLLPAGVFTDLLTDGVIPGIGGVVIFIPQIAISKLNNTILLHIIINNIFVTSL